jgi:hypothetical protein
MISASYRSDYAGEFVVVESKWSGGRKSQTREWIANPIENHHISGRAACIGSSSDQEKFNYTILQRHRGGLLGSKKLQTYGVGELTYKMRLDFSVETRPDQLTALFDNQYSENNIVYTTARNCVNYPGNFYLIPNNPRLLDISTIVYLAAFDGHNEIFLLGYNQDTGIEKNDWHLEIKAVMDAYSGTKFYFVGEPTNMYPEWLDCVNTETMPYKDFIGYCDV